MKATVDLQKCFGRSVTVLLILALAPIALNYTSRGAQEKRQLYEGRPTGQPSGEPNSPSVLVTPDEDYRIGSGDVIEIQVDDAPELSGKFRVSAAGTLLLPHLGRRDVREKTVEELTNVISEGLRGGYLKEPRVSVAVLQINSHLFFIQGAVRRPGVYQIEGRPSLLKLITVAGGLADNYGSSAFIIREINAQKPDKSTAEDVNQEVQAPPPVDTQSEENARYDLTKVNINGLLKGRFDQNVSIEPGSIINIPPSDVFFVAGEVQSPGSFPLKGGTTLRQAISLAAGMTFKAATSRGVIFREDPVTGKQQEIKVDIGDVMNGRKADIAILANDIIIVPNSRMKTISRSLLEAFGLSLVRIPRPNY